MTDEFDGVTVAPNSHKVIVENDQVRVLERAVRQQPPQVDVPQLAGE